MEWYNEAPQWSVEGEVIRITAGAKTDFWRKTHYGFIRDNGHFYYRQVEGDFVAEAKITGGYKALYDQAGLMVRLDEMTWLKTGIEFVEGVQHASVVVTRDFSDWSVVALPQNPPSFWLRLTRRKEAIEVHYALDGKTYTLCRLACLTSTPRLNVGLMCASPDGEGFTTAFEGFTVRTL
jgi:regulation of enolase protein 1 (concanavalin A-like superfamily)